MRTAGTPIGVWTPRVPPDTVNAPNLREMSAEVPNTISDPPTEPLKASSDTGIIVLRQRARRGEAIARSLNEFASSLAAVHSEDDILWEITHRCISVLGFEDCVVYLFDEAKGVLTQRAAYGPKNPRDREIAGPISIPLGRGIVGHVGTTQQAEIIPDTRLDSRYLVDDIPRLSELTVPMISEGRILGVIDSEHSNAGFFTTEHLTILTAVAAITANKLVRARAEEQLRELNNQLEERVRQRTTELAAANLQLQTEIADRTRAEEALRASTRRLQESEVRFRKAFRAIPAHVSLIRLADERFIEINEQFATDSKFTKSEIIGRTSIELNLWVDPAERAQFLMQFRRDGYVHRFETQFRGKTGIVDTALVSAELVEIDGEPCLLALSLSITGRKRMEEELRLSLARERELSRLRSDFVSLVSHEFRTPIGIIHSSAEILERYLDRLPVAERQDHLKAIRHHAWRMAELTEGVLVFGKVEAGSLQYHAGPFDLPAACRRWAKELQMATDNRCPIRFVPESIKEMALGDADLVRHIVSNLISNAVKYSPAGSEIQVRVKREGALGVLEIRDHGLGIPTQDRERLFTAFQRGRNVGQVPGTGLGFVVIKHCLELHHGTLTIDSTENVGTCVTVRLPLFENQP